MALHGFYSRVFHRRRYQLASRRYVEALALIVFVTIFGVVGIVGLSEIDMKNKCRFWGEQVRQNPLIQPANWQLNQCKAVGVPIRGISVRR